MGSLGDGSRGAFRGMGRAVALFVMLFVALTLASPAYAQIAGGIHGTVVDSGGLGIPGATVTVTGPNRTGGEAHATTNDDGYFRFFELIPGVYAMAVSESGFSPVTVKAVRVFISRTTALNVSLCGEDERRSRGRASSFRVRHPL